MINTEDCCLICKKESHYGVVGLRNSVVFHEQYCQSCYISKKRKAEDGENSVNRGSAPEDNEI